MIYNTGSCGGICPTSSSFAIMLIVCSLIAVLPFVLLVNCIMSPTGNCVAICSNVSWLPFAMLVAALSF